MQPTAQDAPRLIPVVERTTLRGAHGNGWARILGAMTTRIDRLIGGVVSLSLVLLSPPITDAQAPQKVQRVGILVTANPRVYDPLVEELRKLGYVDGQTLVLEWRNAEGKLDRLPTIAAELVRSGVDVIVAGGGEAPLRAALKATATIPIVTVAIDLDPVALGLVASLARPGGNGLPEAFALAARDRADAVLVVTTATFFRERPARVGMRETLPPIKGGAGPPDISP
jgi:hypothetical protein